MSGEGLSGRAEAISLSLPADGLENLRVSGVVRLVYKGLNTTFNVGRAGSEHHGHPGRSRGSAASGAAALSRGGASGIAVKGLGEGDALH